MHDFPELVRSDGNELQWMQHDRRAFDRERGIEARQCSSAKADHVWSDAPVVDAIDARAKFCEHAAGIIV